MTQESGCPGGGCWFGGHTHTGLCQHRISPVTLTQDKYFEEDKLEVFIAFLSLTVSFGIIFLYNFKKENFFHLWKSYDKYFLGFPPLSSCHRLSNH